MKKLLALFLSVILAISLLTPAMAYTTPATIPQDKAGDYDSGSSISLTGALNSEKDILTVTIKGKVSVEGGFQTAAMLLSYDNTKLTLLHRTTDSTTYAGTDGQLVTKDSSNANLAVNVLLYENDDETKYTVVDANLFRSDSNKRTAFRIFLMTQNNPQKTTTEETDICQVRFKVNGTLDRDSLRFGENTKDQVIMDGVFPAKNEYSVVLQPRGNSGNERKVFAPMSGVTSLASGYKLIQAIVTYPGSEMQALGNLALSLSANSVTVSPSETPQTVTPTLTALDVEGETMDVPNGITWTFDPEAPTGVTYNAATGAVTVAKTAQSGTVKLKAAIGGVESDEQTITITRPAPAATSASFTQGDAATIVIPRSGSTVTTFTPKLYDQFGLEMEDQTWTWATNGSLPSAVTQNDGVVTTPTGAGSGEFTLTATAQSMAASIVVTIADIEVTWPSATVSTTYTYGQQPTLEALFTPAHPSTGIATAGAAQLSGTFSIKETSLVTGAQTFHVVFTVTTAGDYSGVALEKAYDITVLPKTATLIVTIGGGPFAYDGTAHTPSVTVKDGDTTLTATTDYTVAYTSNTDAGTATVAVTGAGNYAGSAGSALFTITPKSASAIEIEAIPEQIYTGAAITPALTVKDGVATLNAATDYTVAYTNNTNAGTATLTITGVGNYSGTKSAEFTINKKEISVTGAVLAAKTYDKTAAGTVTGVTFDGTVGTLAIGTDYTATAVYNSADAGTDKTATITVTLTGASSNYTFASNQATAQYNLTNQTISPKPLTITDAILEPKIYDGTTAGEVAKVDIEGGTITPNTDYTATAVFDNANAGTGSKTATVTVTLTNSNYTLGADNTLTLSGQTISRAPLTITGAALVAKTYDGTTAAEVTELTFSGLVNSETLTFGTDYEILTASFNSPNVATATTVNGTAALKNTALANNYTLTGTFNQPATITKANAAARPGALNVQASRAKSYMFDLTTLLPADIDPAQVSAYSVDAATDTDSILDGVPAISGAILTVNISADAEAGQTAAIPITFTSSNYDITGADITVTVTDKTVVTLTSGAIADKVYDGNAMSYAASFDDGEVPAADIEYIWSNGSGALSGAPVNAGDYTLTIALSAESEYILSQTTALHFSITKAPLTLVVEDKEITAGNNLPTFTFTVSGLVDGDTWAEVSAEDPTLTSDAVNTTAGTYPITITGGVLENTLGANYEITGRVSGTLTVKAASAPWIDIPSSSGSSGTSNNTPSTGGSVSVSYTQSGGVATVSLPDSKVNEIISKSSDVAVIDLSKATNATSASLPATALTKLANADLEVEIALPQGAITLEADAAASIAEQAGSGSVSVGLKTVSTTTLNAAQKEAVGDAVVYDISVTGGGKQITGFGGASAAIALPHTLKADQKPEGVVALYVDADGNTEALPTTYDASSKKVTFTTTHLSLYAIGYDESLAAAPWVNPFFDIKASDWFYGDVEYAFVNGLMTGVSSTEFAPTAKLSRAMLVTILYRHAVGVDAHIDPPSSSPAFSDVPSNQWYSDAIAWAASNDIVTGVGDNKFAPDEYITREQFATVLYRFATSSVGNGRPGSVAPTGTNISDFTDAGEISSWAVDAMNWAVSGGLINGVGDSKIAPLGDATRAEAAALLRRYIETVNP